MWREKIQITLNQDEIFSALDAYVRSQISVKDGMEISIDMKAGRGENGYSATIDIVPEGTAKAAPATTAAPASKGNPFAKPAAAATASVEPSTEETTSPTEEPLAPVEEPAAEEPEAPAAAATPAGSIFSKAKSLS